MIYIRYYWDGRWFSTGHVSTYYASEPIIIERIKNDIRENLAWWTDAKNYLTWDIMWDDQQAPKQFNITKEEL